MENKIELPRIKCPRCWNKSLEIHGEGITSSGEHYPMENCIVCGFSPSSFEEYSGTVRIPSEHLLSEKHCDK